MYDDITLQKSEVIIRNYDDYDAIDLKHQIMLNLNQMPIDDKMRKDIEKNLDAVPDNPSKEQLVELKKGAMIVDIIKQAVFDHAEEAFKGGHIMLEDGGSLY